MNQNDILTDRALRRNEPLPFLRRGMRLALAAAVALSTPALLAAPGGGKGKPGGGGGDGGGGEDPPPPAEATYSYERIPGPEWAERYRVNNMNNFGDVVGEGLIKKRGSSTNVEGFVWKDGYHHNLPPLPGGAASAPYDLSDDASIVVGESLAPDMLCAWIDLFGSGDYTAINLQPPLLDAAVNHLPEWSFYGFDTFSNTGDESILSSDGNFLKVFGRYPEDPDAPYLDFGIMQVVVQLDWARLMVDPPENPVVQMWAMREPPGSVPEDPFPNGSFIFANEIEIGVRSGHDLSPVVRVAGVRSNWDYLTDNFYEEPVVWEYDVVEDRVWVRTLTPSPWSSGPLGINIYGAAVSHRSLWDADGTFSELPVPEGADPYKSIRGINAKGAVVGPYQNFQDGKAFVWTPEDYRPVDLNTVVGADLGLTVALDINDPNLSVALQNNDLSLIQAGQILAGGSTGWYVLTPIVP